MWLGALPLVVPAVIIIYRRRRRLVQARFIGNLGSRIYHEPWCEYQLKISSFFLRYPLSRAAEAEALGFRPCRVCHPEREEA